jgi:hypothetical protein
LDLEAVSEAFEPGFPNSRTYWTRLVNPAPLLTTISAPAIAQCFSWLGYALLPINIEVVEIASPCSFVSVAIPAQADFLSEAKALFCNGHGPNTFTGNGKNCVRNRR